MSLPSEPETLIIPQQGIVNLGNGDVKVAEKSRQCPICHVYYKYGNSYWQHVRYVHASFLSQCVICEKSYKRTTMAKHHILHSHKIAWHLCSNYVRKIKKSDLSQSREIKSETENRSNNVKYYKKKTLHLISCFNCYDCPGSFATIDELFEHVKSHRGEENDEYYEDIEDNEEDGYDVSFSDVDGVHDDNVEEVHDNDGIPLEVEMTCDGGVPLEVEINGNGSVPLEDEMNGDGGVPLEGEINSDDGVENNHVINGNTDTD